MLPDWEVLPGFGIPSEIDAYYRRSLSQMAAMIGPEIDAMVTKALADGPSRGGVAEAIAYFGPDAGTRIAAQTGRLVSYLEFCEHGVHKWLDASGFGNDLEFIKALMVWADKAEPLLDSLDPITRARN